MDIRKSKVVCQYKKGSFSFFSCIRCLCLLTMHSASAKLACICHSPRQLYSSPTVALPWVAPPVPPKKVSSKVSVLVNEELPDDSSDDEYVPAEEEVFLQSLLTELLLL